MKKFKIAQQTNEIHSKLDAWVQFIKAPESEVIMKLEQIETEIHEAKEELLRLSANDKEREHYARRQGSLIEKISSLESAVEHGFLQGQHHTVIEMAKKLINKSLDDEFISEMTGLSLTEIHELKNDL